MSTTSAVSTTSSMPKVMDEIIQEEERSDGGSNGNFIDFPKSNDTTAKTAMVQEHVSDQIAIQDRLDALARECAAESKERKREISALQGRVAELTTSNSDLLQTKQEQEETLSSQAQSISELTARYEEQKTDYEQMRILNLESSAQLREALQSLSEKDDQIAKLEQKVATMQDQLENQARMQEELEQLRKDRKNIFHNLVDFEGSRQSRTIMRNNAATCGLVGLAGKGLFFASCPPAATACMFGGIALGAAHVGTSLYHDHIKK